MILQCALYFLVGVVVDAAVAAYYLAISRRKAGVAASVGALLTLFSVSIYGALIRVWSPELIAAFSLGTGAGTYLIVKLSKEG